MRLKSDRTCVAIPYSYVIVPLWTQLQRLATTLTSSSPSPRHFQENPRGLVTMFERAEDLFWGVDPPSPQDNARLIDAA